MSSSAVASENASHIRLLRVWTLTSWALSAILVNLASLLPLFDSSPHTAASLADSSWICSLAHTGLRWDAFHFSHIAQQGYVYEYEWAFFPGTPLLMRAMAHLLRFIGTQSSKAEDALGWDDLLLGGMLAALMSSTTTTLYRLTLHHVRLPSIALLAALLSLLPSSPATLRFTLYSEPFFTYFSYRGEPTWTL